MKLFALRLDPDEKAFLEQAAEERKVTVSYALREGAKLYLRDVQEKVHRAKGEPASYLGVRRKADGKVIQPTSQPTAGESRRINTADDALVAGLRSLREGFEAGAAPTLVLAAIGHWLDLVSRLYAGEAADWAWHWWLTDYCPGYADEAAADKLRREIRRSLIEGTSLNVASVLEAIEGGYATFIDELRTQELVRRTVLPRWDVYVAENRR
jgi:hypothetical protein